MAEHTEKKRVEANYRAWSEAPAEYKSPKSLIAYAILAPNTHGSQPWSFEMPTPDSLIISTNKQRSLPASDPSRRQEVITLGCAATNIELAAKALGQTLIPSSLTPTEDGEYTQTFLIEKTPLAQASTDQDHATLLAIKDRITNRSPHQINKAIPLVIHQFIAKQDSSSVKLTVIEKHNHPNTLEQIAGFIKTGMEQVLSDTAFVSELASCMRPNNTRQYDGLPHFVADNPTSLLLPKYIASKKMGPQVAQQEQQLLKDHTQALVVLSTPTDTPSQWFATGKMMQQLAIEAQKHGLVIHPTTVLIEDPNLNQSLKQTLNLAGIPQAAFRLGYPTQPALHTPRRPVERVLKIGPTHQPIYDLKPSIFKLEKDRFELSDLLADLNHPELVDSYYARLMELFSLKFPSLSPKDFDYQQKFSEFIARQDSIYNGRWIYFPWRNSLEHHLDQDQFYKVLYSRNYPILSSDVQQTLKNMRIGVVGMSVGRRIALSLAELGVVNLSIADSDLYELSNTPRAGSSLEDLDLNKTDAAAKAIWNLNPYANLKLYQNGVNDLNREQFVLENDGIIDHMSDIAEKIRLRDLTKTNNRWLLMATDIDRAPLFDIELPNSKTYFNGRPSQETLSKLLQEPESLADWLVSVVKVTGVENMSAGQYRNFNMVIEKNLSYASQLAATGSVAAGMLSAIVISIAEGDLYRLPTFRKIELRPSNLADPQDIAIERAKFESLTQNNG